MKKLLFITIIFLCTGCFEDDTILFPKKYRVDYRLQPYVDEFLREGMIRGRIPKLDNLIIVLVDTPESEPNPFNPGLFTKKWQGQNIIKIDLWTFRNSPKYVNEVIIFHELGHWMGFKHCDPCDRQFNIMHSHPDFWMYDRNKQNMREYCLDLLFNN